MRHARRPSEAAGAPDLEAAIIARLREAQPERPAMASLGTSVEGASRLHGRRFSRRRLGAYARRVSLELVRDPVRLGFAFFGSAILMIVFCSGISLDVRDRRSAAPRPRPVAGEHHPTSSIFVR